MQTTHGGFKFILKPIDQDTSKQQVDYIITFNCWLIERCWIVKIGGFSAENKT